MQNFVKCGQAQDSKMSIERLRSDWNLMTDEEKSEFRTQTSAVDYRALDGGDLFFDSDEEEYVLWINAYDQKSVRNIKVTYPLLVFFN